MTRVMLTNSRSRSGVGMGILANIRRLLGVSGARGSRLHDAPATEPVVPKADSKPAVAVAPTPQPSMFRTPFVRSFEPFKAEKRRIAEWEDPCGVLQWRDKYPYGYGLARDADGNINGRFKEDFRSPVEVEWARTFDRLGLQWEYEPLKFDMGPEYVSYTPDFRVAGLSIPDSDRELYIEVKWFGEDGDLSKYVRFTEWYDCDLLVLAGEGGVLRPRKRRYFLVLKCTHCGSYDWFACTECPTDDYHPPHWEQCERIYRAACFGKPKERIVVPNYFLIQAGTIERGRVLLPDGTPAGRQLSYIRP